MTKIELPVVSRWIIHDLGEDGICERCGWYFWYRINGEPPADEGSAFGPAGSSIFGIRENDNGYVVLFDQSLTPDAEQCVAGDPLWPPGFNLIIEESESVPIPGGGFKAADRLVRTELIPWSEIQGGG